MLSLSVREQVTWWGVALAVFVVLVWSMGQTLLPFIMGAAIAYFLDPVADRLEAMGLSRVVSTAIITLFALVVGFAIIVLVLPLVIQQLQSFVQSAPGYVTQLISFLDTRFPGFLDQGSIVRRGLVAMEDTIKSGGITLLNTVLASSVAVIDFLILLVVTPVVAFYLLLDWDHLLAKISSWLPREHAPVLRHLAREVDRVLGGFVRGQLSVCMILGTFYAVALVAVGLQFGVIVGLVAGLISFIPFVGSIVGGSLSLGLALFQFWDQPIWIGVVAGIFIFGQMVEGNVLTPKLVGGSVGLHPVWLMFALSAFGAAFGFMGLLIAVPVAAVFGVLSRFALDQYLAGRLYRGPENPEPDQNTADEDGAA